MVDIEWAISELDQIYHSEDHFKLSLAAELANMYGDDRVRLEWNPAPTIGYFVTCAGSRRSSPNKVDTDISCS